MYYCLRKEKHGGERPYAQYENNIFTSKGLFTVFRINIPKVFFLHIGWKQSNWFKSEHTDRFSLRINETGDVKSSFQLFAIRIELISLSYGWIRKLKPTLDEFRL